MMGRKLRKALEELHAFMAQPETREMLKRMRMLKDTGDNMDLGPEISQVPGTLAPEQGHFGPPYRRRQKYSDDQPRDEGGRFGESGGGSSPTAIAGRDMTPEQRERYQAQIATRLQEIEA